MTRREFCLTLGVLFLLPSSVAYGTQRSVQTKEGELFSLDMPHPKFWPPFAERLLRSVLGGKTKLVGCIDKDDPFRRTSPLNPQRTIAGKLRPHYGTDYSARDARGVMHQAKCLYAPFDGVVVSVGDKRDGRGEYVVIRSIQNDDSKGMLISHFHMSSQFAPMAGRKENGFVEYHADVPVQRGQAIGLIGDTGWFSNGTKVSTAIHDDIRAYESFAAYKAKKTFDFHPINQLAWELSRPEDYKVLQGRYAHHVNKAFAMRFFASLPQTPAILKTALEGCPPQIRSWYEEFCLTKTRIQR